MLLKKILELPRLREEFGRIREIAKGEAFSITLSGLNEGAKVYFISLLMSEAGKNFVYVVPSNAEIERLSPSLAYWIEELCSSERKGESFQLLTFPYVDTEAYSSAPPHLDIIRRRVEALWTLTTGKRWLLLVSAPSLAYPTIPPQAFASRAISLQVGGDYPLYLLKEKLVELGYQREDMVEEVGDFSCRGGIVDLFSPQHINPLRVEFFADRIESIREFDIITQRSIREVQGIDILPMEEFTSPCNPDESEPLRNGVAAYQHRARVKGSLAGYLKDCLFVLDEPSLIEKGLDEQHQHFLQRYQFLLSEGRAPIPPHKLLTPQEAIEKEVRKRGVINLCTLGLTSPFKKKGEEEFSFPSRSIPSYKGALSELKLEIERNKKQHYNTVVLMPNRGRARRVEEILRDYELEPLLIDPRESPLPDSPSGPLKGRLLVSWGSHQGGFCLPSYRLVVVTSEELFGKELHPIPRKKPKSHRFVSDLRDLKVDDYVVHIDHGIGIYKGLKEIKLNGETKEFMVIMYQEGDRLYLPLDRLNLVHKYSWVKAFKPRLDKLGGTSWHQVKKRVKSSLHNIAQELINLYAARQLIRGYAFSPDTVWQKEFEDAFEYSETPDQQLAIQDMKEDMENHRPMDRLLCGDVGYGKTEVAMRGAFKAVMDGKQIAMLAPTTILAFQHYRTFVQRFRGYPIKMALLSRLQSKKEQKEIVSRIKGGEIDIVIGTHRLLSRDVELCDLGLLVIDEEQRFGVAQKERLKHLKKNVDVLTMTATPIPRTLNMSFMGVRDLSLIETPPLNRLSIQTTLLSFDEGAVTSAIERELARGGQVYFVHNRVQSIQSVARLVQRLCPYAHIAIAHGQMPERELEEVMIDFIAKRYDILVCTSIIENGLDIPSVNTIIINRADKFGMAQLYQLRGRVGRSDRRAYAYFLIPPERSLSAQARKRLQAIKEFSYLGSGFRLAAMDLQIRGSGNLLGREQHGHIAAVGFDLYCQLLQNAIQELKGEPLEEEVKPSLNLGVDCHIPRRWIPDANLRLMLYRRIASAATTYEVDKLSEEMKDQFGPLPFSVANLLECIKLKITAQQLNLLSIDRKDHKLIIRLRPQSVVSPERLVELVSSRKAELQPDGILTFNLPPEEGRVLGEVKNILNRLI
ncbi:transcription-repair coupling factor [bacterium (candidate division B38) B3_B38]|nr:MAG: transcription-repair coupling factor [bacterium (candidate division B38) B3_B38]